MLGWIGSNVASYLFSKFLDPKYKKLTEKLSEAELRKIVADYDARFKTQMEMAARDEEIDLEGIQRFVERELFDDILDCLLISDASLRKRYKEQTLEAAYAASGAIKPKQKQSVSKYLDTVWSMIDAMTGRQLDPSVRVQLNLLDETIEKRVCQAEERIRREILQKSAELLDTTSFAYMIDQINPKEESANAFHYLNPNIGFWGREKEIQALEDFLNDGREILYMGIVAPGGCGKSKLAYEFVQQHRYDQSWEMQYLGKGQIQRLLTFADYRYPKNLLLIVDYAGLYAKQLGDWLYHLYSIQSNCRPVKIRLLLLEREQAVSVSLMTIPPRWMRELHGTGEKDDAIRKLRYRSEAFPNGGVLLPLADDAVIQLMQQFAQRNGRELPEEITQKLFAYLKSKETTRTAAGRPLMAMFITDAYVRGQPVFSWSIIGIIEHYIERTYGQWSHLCKEDTELMNSVSNCVFYATATGQLHLEAAPEYLAGDVERLQTLGDEEYFGVICGINQCVEFENVIFPLEPDIVGEYFLFQKMQKMVFRKEKMHKVMSALWEETNNCFAVFARSIHDYGTQGWFADFCIQNLDVLMPPDRNNLEIEAHSRLLHLMLTVFRGSKREKAAASQIRELYKRYPEHLGVVGDYAAMLMLDFKNHFGNFQDQDKNVEEINRLRLKHPDSEYLRIIYGKSLYNQIVSYVYLETRQSDPQLRWECKRRIQCFYIELRKLCMMDPENKWLQESMARATFMLRYPGR